MHYTFMQCLKISLRSAIGIWHLSLFLNFPWTLWRNIEKLTKVKKENVCKWWLDIFTFQKVFLCIHSYNNMYKLTFTNANNFKTDYVINNNVMICDLFCISSCSEKHCYVFFWSMLIEYPISNNLRLKIVWQLLCMQRF